MPDTFKPTVIVEKYKPGKIPMPEAEMGIIAGGAALSHYVGFRGKPLHTIEFGDIDVWLMKEQWEALNHPEIPDPFYSSGTRVKEGRNVHYMWTPGMPYDPPEIICKFDLTICQIAVFCGQYWMTRQFKQDLDNMTFRVIPRNVHDPMHTQKRIGKYEKRGFNYLGEVASLDDILNNPQEVRKNGFIK